MRKESVVQKAEINNDFLKDHHAYIVTDVGEKSDSFLNWLEKQLNITTKGNPDFSYYKFETLTVDDARNIKDFQEKKAISGESCKVFVFDARLITVEAQNSFLKMFEEPKENTKFFIIGKCVYNLLPTLLSRVVKFKYGNEIITEDSVAENFLSQTKSQRLVFVKKLADDIKDEKKSRSEAVTFADDLELYLYTARKNGKMVDVETLSQLQILKDYLQDRSSSVKMILELISIILPQF